MSKIDVDVMTNGGVKFFATLKYEYNPLFKLDMAEIFTWVLERRPILKYERDIWLFFDHPITGKTISVQLLLKKIKHECED